jgi:hypothetical protein
MPGVAAKAARNGTAASGLPMTTTGSPAPAGKWAASTASPVTESGWPRKLWALVRPLAFRPVSPSARMPKITAVVIQTSRGRGAIAQPTRAHRPRVVGSAEP